MPDAAQQSSTFLSLLEKCGGKDSADATPVADFLRSTPLSLHDLGITTIYAEPTKTDTDAWRQLRRCVRDGEEADALLIFRAMVARLANGTMLESAPLMKTALMKPWRLKAIEAEPVFFQRIRTDPGDGFYIRERYTSNAFHVLADAGALTTFSEQDIHNTIRALKALGVQDLPNPNNDSVCLHIAAKVQTPDALKAFVVAFPQYLEASNSLGYRPLHCAAESVQHGNVKVLLDAGADPRALGTLGTPLKRAAGSKRFKNSLTLLDTGVYNDDDVEEAAEFFNDDEQSNRLRAYHAAMKARQTIANQCDLDQQSGLQPL